MDNSYFVQIVLVFEQNQYSISIFQIYLIFIVCFLAPICYFLTIEIFRLFSRNMLLSDTNSFLKSLIIQKDDILILAKAYISQKKWLSCILMLEFYINSNIEYIPEYNNCIGFCYQRIKLYEQAKKYYIRALELDPANISILKNLATVYDVCNDNQSAVKVYKKVLELDSKDVTALNRINNLSKKYKI